MELNLYRLQVLLYPHIVLGDRALWLHVLDEYPRTYLGELPTDVRATITAPYRYSDLHVTLQWLARRLRLNRAISSSNTVTRAKLTEAIAAIEERLAVDYLHLNGLNDDGMGGLE